MIANKEYVINKLNELDEDKELMHMIKRKIRELESEND